MAKSLKEDQRQKIGDTKSKQIINYSMGIEPATSDLFKNNSSNLVILYPHSN